jgi:hypothetical protein
MTATATQRRATVKRADATQAGKAVNGKAAATVTETPLMGGSGPNTDSIVTERNASITIGAT